jgi:hypothetical protein
MGAMIEEVPGPHIGQTPIFRSFTRDGFQCLETSAIFGSTADASRTAAPVNYGADHVVVTESELLDVDGS